MPHLLIRQRFDAFDRWKTACHQNVELRAEASCVSAQVLHNDLDPHEVFVLFEFTDMRKAEAYMASPELAETWAKAGVHSTTDKLPVTPVD